MFKKKSVDFNPYRRHTSYSNFLGNKRLAASGCRREKWGKVGKSKAGVISRDLQVFKIMCGHGMVLVVHMIYFNLIRARWKCAVDMPSFCDVL
jgi:hypothetical protein